MTNQEREVIKKAAEELECMIDVVNKDLEECERYDYKTCYELLKIAVDS